MVFNQRFTLVGVCMAAGMLAGCAAPYPYQPYPYQSYPGGMYGQPGYVAPGSSLPPGGVQLNAPTPINPGTTGGGDAPMWDPDDTGGSSGGSGSGGNNDVPFYDEPSSGDLEVPPSTKTPDMFEEEKNAYGTDSSPFGLNNTTTESGSRNVAFEEEPSKQTTEQPPILQLGAEASPAVAVENADESVKAPQPISLASAEFEQPVERKEEPTGLSLPYNPDEIPNPFGHDAEGFRFLRGLVAYDDKLKSWSIIYDDQPARDDEYGGVFTLADDPALTVLNDNDVVYIEGHISETVTDAFGKPRYIVKHLNKLKPKTAK